MARTKCRGCGQPIRWAHTCAGQPVPLNPNPDPGGPLAYVATAHGWRVRTFPPGTLAGLAAAERWRPHADTCPRLTAARRPRTPAECKVCAAPCRCTCHQDGAS